MRAIDAAKREFRQDAEELGHIMGRYKKLSGHGHDGQDYTATCKRCDYSIYVFGDICGASCMHPTNGCMDYQCAHLLEPGQCGRKVRCTDCVYWTPKRDMCPRYAEEGVPEDMSGCGGCPNFEITVNAGLCPYFDPCEFPFASGVVRDDALMAMLLEGECDHE